MFIAFVVLFALFYFGIESFNKMTRAEKWDAAKTFSYSLALSLATIVSLVLIVIVF
jgi:hypothetical protein